MSPVISYLIILSSLFQSYEAVSGQQGSWMELDTLELRLTGPCYDVAFYRDGIIFLNPGVETTYLTDRERPGLNNSRPLFANKEFTCSPAAFSFSGDYGKGYYSMPIWIEEDLFEEKIFELAVTGDDVSDIRQLPFTTEPYRYLHPAVSSDGSILIFSSDQLPTSGGLDLFVTRKSGAGWSEPANLGQSINSSGHEWFPFLDSHNNLLFSSTGHTGYGGYDIFICPFNGTGWDAPRNLGRLINGPQNELGFSIDPGNDMALFSRTLPSGSSGLAISAVPGTEANGDISEILQQMADPAGQQVSRNQLEQAAPEEAERNRGEAERNREEAERIVGPEPGRVIFRVQIISTLYQNSIPTVLIEGRSYKTYEYYYLGSYRITVGEFESLKEASAFRIKCLDSGFIQAFVAAFRDGVRVTDPSVFQQ